MKKIGNVLSLFDGISCGQIALNRLNIEYNKYYASEIEKSGMLITNTNFPNTIQLGDVKNINGTKLDNIDLLIGGSPCQSFSFAGKMKGMSTKDNIEILSLEHYLELKNQDYEFEGQSYLFWEYVRILKEVKPRYFLLENVQMKEKWKNLISEILGVEPIKINSKVISAQNRVRNYWTNIPNIKQPEKKEKYLKDILEKNSDGTFLKGNLTEEYIQHKQNQKRWGNHFGTIDTEKSNTLCAIGKSDVILLIDLKRFLTPIECERLQGVPDNYTAPAAMTKRYFHLGNGWQVDTIMHIFNNIKSIDEYKIDNHDTFWD